MKVDVKTVVKTIIIGERKVIVEIPYLLWFTIDENSDLCKKVRKEILRGFGYDEFVSKAGLINDFEKKYTLDLKIKEQQQK